MCLPIQHLPAVYFQVPNPGENSNPSWHQQNCNSLWYSLRAQASSNEAVTDLVKTILRYFTSSGHTMKQSPDDMK